MVREQPTQMNFAYSVDAITAAATDGKRAGHNLGGFKGQVGDFGNLGYRFVARCRTCGHRIVISDGSGGWNRTVTNGCGLSDDHRRTTAEAMS